MIALTEVGTDASDRHAVQAAGMVRFAVLANMERLGEQLHITFGPPHTFAQRVAMHKGEYEDGIHQGGYETDGTGSTHVGFRCACWLIRATLIALYTVLGGFDLQPSAMS